MARAAALVVTVVLLVGCGGDDDDTRADRATPSEATADSPPPTDPEKAVEEADREALSAVVLTKGAEDAARYCVHVIGSREGLEEPPTAAQEQAKDQFVDNAGFAARDEPESLVNGTPLTDFLSRSAETLRNGDCDPEGADKLDAAARRAASASG